MQVNTVALRCFIVYYSLILTRKPVVKSNENYLYIFLMFLYQKWIIDQYWNLSLGLESTPCSINLRFEQTVVVILFCMQHVKSCHSAPVIIRQSSVCQIEVVLGCPSKISNIIIILFWVTSIGDRIFTLIWYLSG